MEFYQLKVTRKGTKPPTWRRCLVPAELKFSRLAEILEEITEYPHTALYEYDFFQKKMIIKNLPAEGDVKKGYEYADAVSMSASDLLDTESWFTFRTKTEQTFPEYRVDIEKKLADPEVKRSEGTEEICYPVILKEVKAVQDDFWNDADEKNKNLKQQYQDLLTLIEKKIEELEEEDEETDDSFSRNPKVRDYLNSYKKEDLVESAKELEIPYKNLSKAEIAAEITERVLEPKVMEKIFLQADEWELDAFERAVSRKCFKASTEDWKDLEWFSNKGYIVAYSDGCAEVPQEVISVYRQINTPELQDKCRKFSWMRCCQGMLGLIYAIAPVKIVYRMYKRREEFRISFEEFMEILNIVCEKDDLCVIRDDKVIWKAVLQDDLYERIEEFQGERDFYIPTAEEILDYAKHGYPSEDPSYKKLHEFMEKELHVEEEKMEEVLYMVYKEFSMDGMLSDIVKELEEYDVVFESKAQIEEFTALMMEVNNNTRMLDFRGFTPNENLKRNPYNSAPSGMMPLPSMVPMVDTLNAAVNMQPKKKVYPNDPCPCGSGKKYKKCCGRN